jgi:hypothetical protein
VHRTHSDLAIEATRYLGAASILAVGAVHAQQYYDAYFSYVPTIGELFLLSFIGSGIAGAALVSPVRLLGRRAGDAVLALAALGAIGIALGSLVALLWSEYVPLFGFRESGYRLAIVLTIVFDVLTTVLLGAFVVLLGRAHLRARPSGDWWERERGDGKRLHLWGALLREQPAVDGDRRPGDVGGVIRYGEGDGRGDVVRVTDAAQGNGRGSELE